MTDVPSFWPYSPHGSVGILFNQLQFHSIMFYSILELENTIAPVYLRTSTEIVDPGLTYYRGGGYITKHRVAIVVRPNM